MNQELLYSPPVRRKKSDEEVIAPKLAKTVTKNVSIIYLMSLFCLGAAFQIIVDTNKPKSKVIDQQELEIKILTQVLSSLKESLSQKVNINPEFNQVVTNQRVKLRNKPSQDSEVLTVIEAGTQLLLLTESENGWLKVTSPMGEAAWIKKEFINE